MSLPKCDPITKSYFEKIMKETDDAYKVAEDAKKMGYDVSCEVEVKRALNLAERTEAIIGPPGIAKRYQTLVLEIKDRTKVIFKIFEEIIDGSLGDIPDESARVEQAIKSALVLFTEGTVVAPLDGLPKIDIGKNDDGSRYVDLYFAGPIRAAGATAAVLPLIFAHRAQVMLNMDGYKATEKEIDRYVEETRLYEKISPRQYKATDEEIRYIVQNCPVCINGTGTDSDVSVNKNLPRVSTNAIRGGSQLVMTDGICLKAPKLRKYAKMFGLDWNWLDKFIKVKSKGGKKEVLPNEKYMQGAAAGRPIFAFPSRFGGFRIRLGRTRTTGLMGKALHPVTMYLLEEFPAVGAQLKVERPGKATSVSACDTIEPPRALLRDGSIVVVNDLKKLEEIKYNVEKILFLGDMLINLGDFRKSGHPLIPVGFCEEWWDKIIRREAKTNPKAKEYYDKINYKYVEPKLAVEISKEFNMPLYPMWTAFYKQMTLDDAKELRNYLRDAKKIELDDLHLELEYSDKLFDILKKIVLPFRKKKDKIIIEEIAYPLLETFRPDKEFKFDDTKDIFENLTKLAGFEIKDKNGSFIGARLGRPEAAKPRKMKGSPHGLFPIGKLGGNIRSINKASGANSTESRGLFGKNELSQVEIAHYKCPKCSKVMTSHFCSECLVRTNKISYCIACKKEYDSNNVPEKCFACGSDRIVGYKRGFLNINKAFRSAIQRLGVSEPDIVKGVEGLISQDKIAEPIEKGILRAKHSVFTFKDGTIRADMLDASITHFKPYELNLSVEKVRKLGYNYDIHGKELVSDHQDLLIYPQDIIINDSVADYFVKVTQFIDDLLVRYYNKAPFYNVKRREDLIGHLALGLAPHTSASVVSRIIGFSPARVIFAHPYHVCARRRNVDGDQDSILLLMDGLLNFSKGYLSKNNGGLMDSPLVATLVIDPTEIDDEVHEMDINSEYDLEVYERAQNIEDTYFDGMFAVSDTLDTDKQYNQIKYTHDTKRFDEGPPQSMYTQIKDMSKKILLQSKLQESIEACDNKKALEIVFNTHLLPDLMGNGRAFARQKFRCARCNQSFRRLPLTGKCTNCGNPKLILTIAEGSVKKYLDIAKKVVYDHNLSPYIQQRMKLLEREINSIFNSEDSNQKNILDFF